MVYVVAALYDDSPGFITAWFQKVEDVFNDALRDLCQIRNIANHLAAEGEVVVFVQLHLVAKVQVNGGILSLSLFEIIASHETQCGEVGRDNCSCPFKFCDKSDFPEVAAFS